MLFTSHVSAVGAWRCFVHTGCGYIFPLWEPEKYIKTHISSTKKKDKTRHRIPLLVGGSDARLFWAIKTYFIIILGKDAQDRSKMTQPHFTREEFS